MEAEERALISQIILRQMRELLKVKEQLNESSESGTFPGEKTAWILQKLSDSINDLGHILSLVEVQI